ncbi:MAG: hypothetical protein MZV70_50725 [Desulfobacterales bacterium]|nr:hypothetical protein [Desulfobacterales bacterium]
MAGRQHGRAAPRGLRHGFRRRWSEGCPDLRGVRPGASADPVREPVGVRRGGRLKRG